MNIEVYLSKGIAYANLDCLDDAKEQFDAADYLMRYPDVKNCVGNDTAKAYEHYTVYGKEEGRIAKFL